MSDLARRLQAGFAGKTDAAGNFTVPADQGGTYNIEAVLNDSTKAWLGNIAFSGPGANVAVGVMQLGPVGSISGRVKSILPTVTDFSNTSVYIPGSSYVAMTGPDGNYTISSVPVGAFKLAGYNVNLGDARLPDAENPDPIRTVANQAVRAPALVLQTHAPELTGITRARTTDPTDNAAPGTAIDLRGGYFGFSRGATFQVQFSGGLLQAPERLSEGLIRVVVPVDAQNGQVNVVVGGLPSQPLPFRVMKNFSLGRTQLTLTPGATFDLGATATATDSSGAAIVELFNGTQLVKARPNISWTVDNSNLGIVSDRGIVTAASPGVLKVTGSAGNLAPAVATVTISAPAGPTPTPAPTPTTTPTAQPTSGPVSTPKPVVFPSGTSLLAFSNFLDQAAGGRNMPSLVYSRRWFNLFNTGPYVYAFGGENVTGNTKTIYFPTERASMNADGTFGPFATQSGLSLRKARSRAALASANGWVYVVGGLAYSPNYLASIEQAKINTDGTLGEFSLLPTTLAASRSGPVALVAGGYVYVMGGYTGDTTTSRKVERAPINADGSLGTFLFAPGVSLKYERYSPTIATTPTSVYLIGSEGGLILVERAPINADGTLGTFVELSSRLLTPRPGAKTCVVGNTLYVMGGSYNGFSLTSIEQATINADGSLGPFSVAPVSLASGIEAFEVLPLGSSVWTVGGQISTKSGITVTQTTTAALQRAFVSGTGQVGAFAPASAGLAKAGRESFPVVAGNTVSLVGGYTPSGYLDTVDFATVGSDGTLSSFTPTSGSTLVTALMAPLGAVVGPTAYALGGYSSSGLQSTAQKATIGPSGSLGNFSNVAGIALTSPLSGATTAVLGSHLYLVGGSDGTNRLKAVQESGANSYDGSLGGFVNHTSSLVAGRAGHASVVLGNYLYVLGGLAAGSGTAIENSAERAPIDANGVLGAFATVPGVSFVTPRAFPSVAAIGGYLYVFGGNNGASYVSSVERAQIAQDGSLGAFQSVSGVSLGTARNGINVLVLGNSVYAIGGGPTPTIERAPIE